MKLGLLGLKQMAVPPLLQPSSLLVKLGILESQSTEPRKNSNSQCRRARLSSFSPQAVSLPFLVSSRSFVNGLCVNLAAVQSFEAEHFQ